MRSHVGEVRFGGVGSESFADAVVLELAIDRNEFIGRWLESGSRCAHLRLSGSGVEFPAEARRGGNTITTSRLARSGDAAPPPTAARTTSPSNQSGGRRLFRPCGFH